MAGSATGEAIMVPSGQEVRLIEVVQAAPGPGGLTVRFRFLAPAIARDGGSIGPEAAQADMAHLCEAYVMPRLANIGPAVAEVVISLADRAVAFGAADPEATQFFEAYRVEGGACIWEPF